jgi:hypothetical protein
VLPEDRADTLYHRYAGGGVTVDGPSLLVRRKIGEHYSVAANYCLDFVSSVSNDVMTQASPCKEERRQASRGFDMLNGRTRYSVAYANSDESDYTANTASVDLSQSLFGDLTRLPEQPLSLGSLSRSGRRRRFRVGTRGLSQYPQQHRRVVQRPVLRLVPRGDSSAVTGISPTAGAWTRTPSASDTRNRWASAG